MKKNIITISREFGSGGGMIGKMVAEQRVTNSLLYNIALGASYGYGVIANNPNQMYSLPEQVYLAQKKAIQDLADHAPWVIVGRCADYALRGREDVLNIFIYADMEERIKRVVHEYGLDISAAKAEILKSDKSCVILNTYGGMDMKQPLEYTEYRYKQIENSLLRIWEKIA